MPPRRPPSRHHQRPATSTSPAPCASRPRSTSPTPSTSTAPSPTTPPPRRPSGPSCHSTHAGPRPWATSPGPRPPSTSTPSGFEARSARTSTTDDVRRTCRPRARSSSTPTSTPPLRRHHSLRPDRADRGGPATDAARPGPVLVRRLPHQDDRQAGHRPQRQPKSAPGYDIPDRIREHITLRDRTCVFPWCARPARGCDVDHVIRARPPRRSRRPTAARTDPDRQPRLLVPVPPPPQDPHRLALRDDRARGVRVDLPTATTTAATTPAPPPSTHPTPVHPGSRHPEDDPAPHPAACQVAGPQACSGR